MTTALVDNTVISNFAHVTQPQLLQVAFDDLVTTSFVSSERAEGDRLERIPSVDWRWLREVELGSEETEHFEELRQRLGTGEASCLAVAQARGWIVLTDDRNARREAVNRGIAVSGTLGALINLLDLKVLTLGQADELLAQMKQHGYHAPIDSLQELLD